MNHIINKFIFFFRDKIRRLLTDYSVTPSGCNYFKGAFSSRNRVWESPWRKYHPHTGEPVCGIIREMVCPELVLNAKGRWKFLVNIEWNDGRIRPRQCFNIEKCR